MTSNVYFQLLIIIVLASLHDFTQLNNLKPENPSNTKEDDHSEYSSRMSSDAGGLSSAMELSEKFFQWRLKENPEYATALGIHDYDDQLDSWTQETFEKQVQDGKEFLVKVKELLKTNLTDKDALNMQLLKADLELMIEGMKYKGYVYPINYLEGVQVDLEQTVSFMKFEVESDYNKLLSRYRAFPKQADELIEIMRLGIKEKKVPHHLSLDPVLSQFSLLQVAPENSTFYSPFNSIPNNISSDIREKLQAEGKKLIETTFLPAFKKIQKFIEEEYIPASRPDIAATTLPDGENYYQQCLTFHLSLPLTPKEVHEKGLEEVARITNSIEKIKNEIRFNGNLTEFFKQLRSNKDFYFTKKEEILEGYRDLEFNKITPKLLSFFPRIPETKLIIKDVPPAQAHSPAAYYQSASLDGSRPGVFFVNTNSPDKRPKYEMASLALHEGLPGHHFQTSYIMEEKGLPKFRLIIEDRRYAVMPSHFPLNTAYLEGWGLYSEYLGEEMGIYTDPYSLVGRYSNEILRACRLVVDTGMHALGWSVEKAVTYMLNHIPDSEESLRNEVSRYITWPGQACAYKIGEMKIKELRKLAQETLGDKYDVKEFHGIIMKNGAVPLHILEKFVQEYIKGVQEHSNSKAGRHHPGNQPSQHLMFIMYFIFQVFVHSVVIKVFL